ncbi:ATP-dependent DNA helicase PIF1 [Nibea albiflora]|nr:ATP-dependent DNA helicase PIF1 [Nibea albiflora]
MPAVAVGASAIDLITSGCRPVSRDRRIGHSILVVRSTGPYRTVPVYNNSNDLAGHVARYDAVLNKAPAPVRGTGQRHRVRRWEQSQLTNKPHKLVIPAGHANKKFVLLVGDSHLRALVDGFVAMPEGPLSFGFMSTPGATAAHLRTELVAAVVPRQPDAVVVLAPSNNLTACRGLEDSSADFAALVKSARSRWSNVVVLDFPPRLSVAEAEQGLLRMAYHSVCVEQGVPFHHIAENFPLRQRDLWARDGTHLSDNVGMPILAYLLWQAADRQLAEPEPVPEPPVSAVPACPYRPRFATQVVVSGHEPQPRPAANPDGWVTVVRGQKRSLPEAELAALDAQLVQKKVVLKECFIPLTPVRFSPTLLRAVEKTSPSFLPSPEVETAVPVHIQKRKVAAKRRTVVARRRLPREQVDTAVSEVAVAKPVNAVPVAEKMDTDVEVVSVVTPTSAVSTPVMDENEATHHAVDLTSEPGLSVPLPVRGGDEVQPPHPATPGSAQLGPTPGANTVGDISLKHVSQLGSIVQIEKSIRGSFHQGNAVLRNPGVQCMAVSLVSIAKHSVHSVFDWEKKDLDSVLFLGDDLYSSLRCSNMISGGSRLLCVPDLPQQSVLYGQTFAFVYGEWVTGTVGVDQGELVDAGVGMSLVKGLEYMLGKYSTCFLTLAASTCAVICEHGRYAVVDSHARNACGMVDANGKSVVVHLPTLEDVCNYACRLSVSLGAGHRPFEIAAVSVTNPVTDDHSSDCLSEHVVCAEDSVASSVSESASVIERSSCKRKRANVNVTFKKRKSSDITAVNSDVEFICDVSSKGLQFDPLDKRVAQALCKQLNVDFEKQDRQTCSSAGMLGTPCTSDSIVADGNCFFRAVSQAVSGTQKNHLKVRRAVVRHVERNALQYTSFLRSQYSTVDEYLNSSRMRYVGSWATEFEIQATADLLGVSIYTYYNDRWLKYSCKNKAMSKQGIYLQHVNGCHYEVVVCVNQPRLQNCNSDVNVCFELCKDSQSLDTQYMARRPCKQSKSNTVPLKSSLNYCYSKYLKTKLYDQFRSKYQSNVLHREKKKDTFKRSYHQNMLLKEKKRQISMIQYKKNKDIIKDSFKMKYNEDEVHREIKKTANRMKYQEDDFYRQNMKTNKNRKYREDNLYRNKVKSMRKKKYNEDDLYKTKQKGVCKQKYRVDDLYREKMIDQYKRKYKQDYLYRKKIKDLSKKKYENDEYRKRVKSISTKKYHENDLFRDKVKILSKQKYHKDLSYQNKAKERSKIKYKINLTHRHNIKAKSTKTYHESAEFRKRVSEGVKLNRQQLKVQAEDFDFVMQRFLDKVKDGPDFVCCVCHRLLFKHQVLQCRRDYYRKKGVCLIADNCITENYLHVCTTSCERQCSWVNTPRSQLWICYTCHYKINKGQVPAESIKNNLALDPVPLELACLNKLEQHLIALHIPFMKMLALPKGGQNGVHGPVTCVPANIIQTTNLLPRTSMEGSLLPVKLKRKLTYKGHYEYEYIDTAHIKEALQYLKENNVYYKEVNFNAEWFNEFCKADEADPNGGEDKFDSVEQSDVHDDELLHDRQQHCMFQDTCLMPVDIGQEALDQYFGDVLNLAPAEGNCPVKFLTDHSNEARCFPVLFPTGSPTYHDDRQHRLTLSRYFNNRILNADGRFAQNVEYIFFAQYMSELEKVVSNVSIALRKGKGNWKDHKVSREAFNTEESLRNLLEFDEGYRFLKPLRGTPAFWQGAQRDLLACVRQLGIPTWFCSFSAADMRWKNLLSSILKQAGRTDTVEQLEWADRCELLRRNPVTAARMFDFRWHCFLREVLMSPANPIGKIKDYFYRVEFQQRGSPHVHCLFWIENAPIIDKNTDAEVIQFIDRYVTCELPSNDEELLDTVTSVQQHSKRHSKTCKKGKTVCRFNFPRPPSARTFISRSVTDEENTNSCACKPTEGQTSAQCACRCKGQASLAQMKTEVAAKIMSAIKEAVRNDSLNFETAEELFRHVGVTQARFEAAYNCCASKTQVVLKRQANAVWINQYSKPLLKCWNANIDIQFVVDAYACVVYIISYISKAEKEMGLLLQCAQREAAKEGNRDAKDSLKNLGSVYLHNRDVCAQEAVYRLTNMHLKECSRKVVFVPVGENTVRMSLPLKVLQHRASSDNFRADDMWMLNLVDRYRNRPGSVDFQDMCLASFASQYRVLSKSETAVNKIQLGNDCGYIVKRTRTQPAVVRYVRFSETKKPELFYQSILQLFLPYYTDGQLKPVGFETFQDFYLNGQVRCADNLMQSVKSVVDRNRSTFEVESEELDNVEEQINNDGIVDDAWCELCPEQELDRLECREMRREESRANNDEQPEHIPDLAVQREQTGRLEKRNSIMCRSDGLAFLRSLNETQMGIFNQVRQWCVQQAQGKKPDPFHIFVTGGAGTGKSHLIRAIQYEATRILAPVCRHPDDICVLLTAPTGIAAYNLHATTIHSTFSIGKDVRLPYTPLGEEKLNSLRAKYSSLQIVIIDEISMVDHNLLAYIHGRLRQIKQIGDSSLFGRIAIIAVGDFFQLPPVRGKPLYVQNVGIDLWSGVFNIAVLNTIVRQKDEQFAKLLNRVRTHSKGTAMLGSDVQLLKSRETGEESSALHIFPTNRQVSEHNLEFLLKTCPDYVCISAQDYINSKKTGKLVLLKGHHSDARNTCLEENLLLGKGARVMLFKNIDVADGLVNGVCGAVTDIVYGNSDKTFPRKVYIKFDNADIGKLWRKRCAHPPGVDTASVGIDAEEERVTCKGGMRRQFPLKLAWACTVHKVQGLTIDEAVVSLDRVFAAGQAYVALSRVRSLSGLVLKDFEQKAIYCKDSIKEALNSMSPFLIDNIQTYKCGTNAFSVFLMNVHGLGCHAKDLALCVQHLKPQCVAVTETWLSESPSVETVTIDGYHFHSVPRNVCYSDPRLLAIKAQQHGGVAMYTSDNLDFDIIEIPSVNIECLIYNFTANKMLVAVVYRPPAYPMSLFIKNLGKLLEHVEPLSESVTVMGDFNENLVASKTFCNFMTQRGFVQHVSEATTAKGTLIDHVYVKTTHSDVSCVVLQTYFSDHDAIMCEFTRGTDNSVVNI